MQVLLLSKYSRLGASSRVRALQYIPALKARGIEITIRSLFDDQYLEHFYKAGRRPSIGVLRAYWRRSNSLSDSGRYDLIWLEKELFPWVPYWLERGWLRRFSYVVDYDDAIFHAYDSHPWAIVRRAMGEKIDRIMRGAATVMVGNDYLASRAREAGARAVMVVPTVVDLARYFPCVGSRQAGDFRIGWIGSPATSSYLDVAAAPLVAACEEGGTEVILVGASSGALGGLNCDRRQWQESSEVRDIQEFDIGIMPLPDRPWERGKCGYKLIQYMACGKPVVASPVGINREIVINGKNGFLAENDAEWAEALHRLKVDAELRERMGQEARKTVEERFNLDVTAPKVADILMGARSEGRCKELASE